MKRSLIVDNREIFFEDEKNLLEVIRKAGIDLPTFCYHSELSVYGACRLCMVDIDGRGIQASCSISPESGMKIRTNTPEIREMRKTIVGLLLSNHDYSCVTCAKSNDCRLQSLARKVGIDEVEFKNTLEKKPLDKSSVSIVRDPNRCILCGDCVRMCEEIQSVGAIDFAHRGSKAEVLPSFGKDLDSVECVNCGQCVRVCPTGALTSSTQIDKAWEAIHDRNKKVVVQIAPAVRVALGERFGLEPGTNTTGKIVSALRSMGADRIYDTSFTADLTIMEETEEFLERAEKGDLPMFTSCCPSWIKFAEQYFPELLPSVSSCKSPQQMFGSVAKNLIHADDPEETVVISIMPCTAKKFEADRPEFSKNGVKEVDIVLTTNELATMIEEQGMDFAALSPDSLDLPLGFKTGAGVIFGNSGGVAEAVLRYARERLTEKRHDDYEFHQIRGTEGFRKAELEYNGKKLSIGIVHGLGNARKLIKKIEKGEEKVDFVEVMACPGGCVGGAGQPVPGINCFEKRREGLYNSDKTLQLHSSQHNPYINKLYSKFLDNPGSEKAHSLLHTKYKNRKRTAEDSISLTGSDNAKVKVAVCVGTSCYTHGSQKIISEVTDFIEKNGLEDQVDLRASFCFEKCDKAPNVRVNGEIIGGCTSESVIELIKSQLQSCEAAK
ncbi:MAG: [FeFe] hydrogenase, group A [Candidatus Muiribacteriaceae bacterium]